MNEQTAMHALIRKDARILFPLVAIAWITCLACNLLLFLGWQYWDVDRRSLYSSSVAIWVMIPGLVSFGTASMLIGTEEDSGTLTWLRTLPVSWQKIAASKLTVGLAAFVSVWLLASFLLWLFSYGWADAATSVVYGRLSFHEVSSVLFLQVLLLLLGFAVSYRIRMPLAGLLTLFPLFLLVIVALTILMEWVLRIEPIASPAAIWVGIVSLVFVGLVQHALAHRRLTRPDSTRAVLAQENLAIESHYRPPFRGVGSRPSASASLLWQQCRQTAPACVSLIGVSLLLTFLLVVTHERSLRNGPVLLVLVGVLSPMFLTLSASWLGVLTFYGDNRHRRHAFLADRGISPTLVWWTRIVPTMAACFVLASVVFACGYILDGGGSGAPWLRDGAMFCLLAVLFAFGQLVSQAIERPVLAFLAAPAYAFVCLTPVSYVLYLSDISAPEMQWILLMVPVLLFASWQLSRRWLEGENMTAYGIQMLGYTILAVALPCLVYGGSRVLSLYVEHL